jgi:hypothetical protein
MHDDLMAGLAAAADEARSAARVGTSADIRGRARRQRRAAGFTAVATGATVALAGALIAGALGSTRSAQPVSYAAPDPSVYLPAAWLPAADAPMASVYQWGFTAPGSAGQPLTTSGLGVQPICGSAITGSNAVPGQSQTGRYTTTGTSWTIVQEELYFLPSDQDAQRLVGQLTPDQTKCDQENVAPDYRHAQVKITARVADGIAVSETGTFTGYTGYQAVPRAYAQHFLIARHAGVVAIFTALASWAPGTQGPAYDTGGDQAALAALAAHVDVYRDQGPSNASGAVGAPLR